MPRKITVERLDSLGNPTLEDILAFLNGGKYEKFFLIHPREFPDGSRKFMTRKGGKLYGKLTSLVYAVARCTNVDRDYERGHTTEDVVEILDDIVGDPI